MLLKIKAIFERSKFTITSTDSLCGMQLGMSMSGAVSSRVCVRRSSIIHTLDINYFCDPLGGSTYFTPTTLSNTSTVAAANDVLLVAARLDTFTLFEAYTPGANEPVSGLLGLFIVADMLTRVRADLAALNVVFVLVDNEAFDYGGSTRLVSDLVRGAVPLVDLLSGQTINLGTPFNVKKKDYITII